MTKKIKILVIIIFFFFFIAGLLLSISFYSKNKVSAQSKCVTDADIVFAIDSTGSMVGVIGEAKSRAMDIMNSLESALPGADLRFGVVDFRDYADGGSWPYIERQILTRDKSAVQSAINIISAGGGGDAPEAYARVMYESYTSISYHPDVVRILIMMGDNRPHDKAPASATSDPAYSAPNYYDPIANISTDDIAANMKSNRIILINLHSGPYSTMWAGIAQVTGGDNYPISSSPSNLVDIIVEAVIRAVYDKDGDGFVTIDCPCDPNNPPLGLQCYDCNDDPVTGPTIQQQCLYGGPLW